MAFIPKGEHMLRKLREARDEEGFTLIELLVVVIIIGILAAIAIPVFLNQRQRAYVSAAESDARNAAIEVESYFAENDFYPGTAGTATDLETLVDIEVSTNVTLEYTLDASPSQSYVINACHDLVEDDCTVGSFSGNTAVYDSDAGGLQ